MRTIILLLLVVSWVSPILGQEQVVTTSEDVQILLPLNRKQDTVLKLPATETIFGGSDPIRIPYEDVLRRAEKTCRTCLSPDYNQIFNQLKAPNGTAMQSGTTDLSQTPSSKCLDCDVMDKAIRALVTVSKAESERTDSLEKHMSVCDSQIQLLRTELSELKRRLAEAETKIHQLQQAK